MPSKPTSLDPLAERLPGLDPRGVIPSPRPRPRVPGTYVLRPEYQLPPAPEVPGVGFEDFLRHGRGTPEQTGGRHPGTLERRPRGRSLNDWWPPRGAGGFEPVPPAPEFSPGAPPVPESGPADAAAPRREPGDAAAFSGRPVPGVLPSFPARHDRAAALGLTPPVFRR